MSRYDKYDPISGGFRAPLAAAYTGAVANLEFGKVIAVSLNASGQVVIGTAGATGFVGVMVLHEAKAVGEIVDVMTAGEIVEFTLNDGTAAASGTVYFAAANGTVSASAPAAGTNQGRLGVTIEATRLVVRAAIFQG